MSYYSHIFLTPEEIEEALEEGRKKKYFHEKSKDYWIQQEKGTTKQVAYQSEEPVSDELKAPIDPVNCSSSK